MRETDPARHATFVAFHFPPVKNSSGIQRTLKFATYLPDYGWSASVLTVAPRAYPSVMDDQMRDIPPQVDVCRAFALDAARHLAIAGRYSRFTALPDRWVSWLIGAVTQGLAFLRRKRPAVLVSTYPIATAHLVGLVLHRLTGIPWVADCRDSMTEPGYPRDPLMRRIYLKIERAMVHRAARVVFTTPGARAMYAERYPEVPAERWAVIENGYDEANFDNAEALIDRAAPTGPVRIVHSGVVYPSERDPGPMFEAIAKLKAEGFHERIPFEVVLRATGHDALYRPRLEALGITDIVRLEPAVGYEAALAEMLNADGLLLLQAANCNHQIPAKLYEYLRAGRPILALTDHAGDTAGVMRSAGLDTIAALDDAEEIGRVLAHFLERLRTGAVPTPDPDVARSCSRRIRTRLLAELLDEVAREAESKRN